MKHVWERKVAYRDLVLKCKRKREEDFKVKLQEVGMGAGRD
jgi:hypothetical protein